MANLIGSTPNAGTAGVFGENTNNTGAAGVGVHGKSHAAGVVGESTGWHGVSGYSSGGANGGQGVYGMGRSANVCGVFGESTAWYGVYGTTPGTENGCAGVGGEHKGAGIGVKAVSKDGIGLAAYSIGYEAVHAETQSLETAAIAAYNLNPEATGAAVFAKKEGSQGHAGFFDGNVWISGDLGVGRDITLANADCAEDFDIADSHLVEPGMVMVLGEEGVLEQSQKAYDKRVAGVVSGAGKFKPGIILDKRHSQPSRKPIALLGKVYCKVDASCARIEIGDMLTTATMPGHAMKATDRFKAFGAVLGKALQPLSTGQGLIPILVALQ